MKQKLCAVCGKNYPEDKIITGYGIPHEIESLIREEVPQWQDQSFNLILSCIAAIQAPIIMMSHNRQEAKDRIRSENDYKVNLKAEIEVRTLHEKIDHLLLDQWSRMMQIQQVQLDMLEEIQKAKIKDHRVVEETKTQTKIETK